VVDRLKHGYCNYFCPWLDLDRKSEREEWSCQKMTAGDRHGHGRLNKARQRRREEKRRKEKKKTHCVVWGMV